jgi:uncharacterized OsmC-like protein
LKPKEEIMSKNLNGWNLDAMKQAIDEVEKAPEAGRLTWRSRVNWDGGFGLDVRTRNIEQLGQQMDRHFTLRGDHPPELLGSNTGPTAVETLFAALGACMAGTFAAQATARGVEIDALEVDVEGQIDLNGFFGLKAVPPGISDVRLAMRVKSEAAPAVLQEVLEAARAHSPVFDSMSKPIAISSTVTSA